MERQNELLRYKNETLASNTPKKQRRGFKLSCTTRRLPRAVHGAVQIQIVRAVRYESSCRNRHLCRRSQVLDVACGILRLIRISGGQKVVRPAAAIGQLIQHNSVRASFVLVADDALLPA